MTSSASLWRSTDVLFLWNNYQAVILIVVLWLYFACSLCANPLARMLPNMNLHTCAHAHSKQSRFGVAGSTLCGIYIDLWDCLAEPDPYAEGEDSMNAPARFESFLLLSGEKKWVIIKVISLDHEDGTVLVMIPINAHRTWMCLTESPLPRIPRYPMLLSSQWTKRTTL